MPIPCSFRKQIVDVMCGKDTGLFDLPLAAFLPIFTDAVRRAETGVRKAYPSFRMSPECVEKDKNAMVFGSWVDRHLFKGEYRESDHCGFDVHAFYETPAGALGFSKGDRATRVVFSVSSAIKPLPYGCLLVSLVWLLLGSLLVGTLSGYLMNSKWVVCMSPKMDERYTIVFCLCFIVAAGIAFMLFGLLMTVQERCFPSSRQLRSKTLASSVVQIVEEAFTILESSILKASAGYVTKMTLSDKIQVVRDGVTFGPYSVSDAVSYFERGLLFEHDLAFEFGKAVPDARPIVKIFKDANVKPKSSPVWRQFGSLVQNNHALLLPVKCLFSRNWFSDKQTMSLMMIGCAPLVLMVLNSKLVGYVGLAAYFSALWGIFFFTVFKTSQASAQDAVRVFFQTPLFASVLISVTRYIPPFTTLYGWTLLDSLPVRWVGMFLAVAMVEETCKVLPVYLLARHPGRVLQPRTVVLYGIISGLGFGIWEGVAYQLGINRKQGVDMAYFLNVLRLTSLPFIHAIWAGISSYFVGFSMLLPNARWSLRIIAVLIPAMLHSTHNTFPGVISVVVDLLSVALLMLYLGNGQALFAGIKKGSGATP